MFIVGPPGEFIQVLGVWQSDSYEIYLTLFEHKFQSVKTYDRMYAEVF